MRGENNKGLGKLPPQAIDLEEAILGAIMLEKDALINVIGILDSDSFYKESHKVIFKAIIELFNQNESIDLLTVTNKLRKNGELEIAGGAFFITELTSRVSSAAHIEEHSRIVYEMSMKRDLISLGSEIQKSSYEDTTDAFEILDMVASKIISIDSSISSSKSIKVSKAMFDVIKKIQLAAATPEGLTGIPSGYNVLDKITRGFQNSDLIIIAARPAMGKTDLALNIAVNASQHGFRVAFFSLEMSTIQLTERILAISMKIEREKIKSGQLSESEWLTVSNFPSKLGDKIIIQDEPTLSVMKLRALAKKLKASEKIDMIIVDYLQLMDATKGAREGNEKVSIISRHLKLVAKELNIPVIALSQLSRAVETRGGDKRPQLSDLRDSGSIEQDADIVMFPYRPQYYGIMEMEDGTSTKQLMETDIAKNRSGRVGKINLKYLGQYGKVDDWNNENELILETETIPKSDYYSVPKFHSNGLNDFENEKAPF
jgi:replicative DNA helicase